MGALSKFLGSPKEVEINGKKIELQPLKVKDMESFSKKENMSEAEIKAMGIKMVKLSIPDTTDDEIENMDMASFVALMDEINKLNGFKDERLESIKKRIAEQKQ